MAISFDSLPFPVLSCAWRIVLSCKSCLHSSCSVHHYRNLPLPLFSQFPESEREVLLRWRDAAIAKERELCLQRQARTQRLRDYVQQRLRMIEVQLFCGQTYFCEVCLANKTR